MNLLTPATMGTAWEAPWRARPRSGQTAPVQIAGSVAVVTGASSGIGRAVAVDLAARGAVVAVVARRQRELEETADLCRRSHPDCLALVGDVAAREDCEKVAGIVHERFGRADIVVNNAGISSHKDVRDTTIEDVQRLIAVNFLGAVNLTTQFLPGMVQRGRGFIVNVGSVAGTLPNPKEAAYGASKAALHNWTHGLRIDLHGTGVHAGLLSPGPIDTEIWEKDETPSSFDGKKHPPEVVAAGAARMIEKELVHLTVPRRYGAVGPMYNLPLVGRAMRWGLVRFEEAGSRG